MRPMLYVGVICGVAAVVFLALTTEVLGVPKEKPCTQAWFLYLHNHYIKTIDVDNDADGGPNLGDADWFHWFEGSARISTPPQLSEQQRCQFIQESLQERVYIVNPQLAWVFILKVH